MVRRTHGRAGFHARKGGRVRTAVYRPPTASLGGIVPITKLAKAQKAMQILAMANEVRKAYKKHKKNNGK